MKPFIACLFGVLPTLAHPACFDDAMVVLDFSWSMAESGAPDFDRPKIAVARDALGVVVAEAAQNRQIGFVSYGPGGSDDCNGVTVHFPPMPNAAQDIIKTAGSMNPLGSTPLTAAVEAASGAMPVGGTVVLITDGAETCQGSPCTLAANLADQGDYTVHVIGFKVKGAYREPQSRNPDDFFEAEAEARCLADQTGGTYASAQNLDDLIVALRQTLGCPLIG